jgi:hypothetical protein
MDTESRASLRLEPGARPATTDRGLAVRGPRITVADLAAALRVLTAVGLVAVRADPGGEPRVRLVRTGR